LWDNVLLMHEGDLCGVLTRGALMWVTGRSPVCNLMFFLMDTQSRVCYTAGGTTAADERKSARSGRKIGFPASGSQPM
jgi:hypothetical protein